MSCRGVRPSRSLLAQAKAQAQAKAKAKAQAQAQAQEAPRAIGAWA